jgi:hypothetical protein
MLRTGLKGGNLVDFRYINLIAKTAEQIANVNISSKIKGLSDAGKTNIANTIYHTQIRDRLTLVAVYVSSASLSSPSYPFLNAVSDENGVNLLASYSSLGDALEEFDHEVDGAIYKVTFLKKTYAVDPSVLDKRGKYEIYPMALSFKDFDTTYLNSMFIMQIDANITDIDLLTESETSSYSYWNKIKEAFRLNMSYNMKCVDNNGNEVTSVAVARFLNYMNDFYECGGDEVDYYTSSIYGTYPGFFEKTVTAGTSFSYTVFTQNNVNTRKLNQYKVSPDQGDSIQGALYLTTTDTLNLAINSIFQDALNSYDLVMLNRDFANRLQGKLYYPTIGDSLVTTGNAECPIDLNIVMNNNIDNLNFNKELTLINGYKLKFSIS